MNDTYLESIKQRHAKATIDPDAVSSSLSDIPILIGVIDDYRKSQTAADKAINEFFEKHSIWSRDDFFPDKLLRFIGEADRAVMGATASYKRLVDDMLVYFRALAIIAETVGNSATHSEKAARTRGLIETLESAIKHFRDEQFHIIDLYWRSSPDLFTSDYPVREYKERIYRLEQELNTLKTSSNGQVRPEPITPESKR